MTPRQILIGLAYIGQMIDLGDRDLQATSVDQAGKFCKYLGIRRRAVALRLDAVFRGRREVDDRIDPIRRDTEFERQIHIAAAERVDEGIDFASGCGSDPIRDAFPISDWDHTVVSEPGMVCCVTTVSPAFNAPFSYPLKRCIVRAGSMSGPRAGERAGGVRITV